MNADSQRPLRADVLRFPRPDGGLDILDLLMDRFHRFDAVEAAAIAAGDPTLWARLDGLFLTEGDMALALREAQWSARAEGMLAQAQVEQVPEVDWDEASRLPPDVVSAQWRRPQALQRAAQEHAAGRHVVILRDFLTERAAQRLHDAACRLPFKALNTDIVSALRCWLGDDDLPEWRAFFHDATVRKLLGGVLGVSPAPETTINVWKLRPHSEDRMRAHLDGRRYAATFSVGLSPDWLAADGGAIAFGQPTKEGFVVQERWLPFLGDLCLFLPRQALWHAVEPVSGERPRLTLTGWWMA
jgi:hypothetical protein